MCYSLLGFVFLQHKHNGDSYYYQSNHTESHPNTNLPASWKHKHCECLIYRYIYKENSQVITSYELALTISNEKWFNFAKNNLYCVYRSETLFWSYKTVKFSLRLFISDCQSHMNYTMFEGNLHMIELCHF